MKVSTLNVKELIVDALVADLVPFISSSPGIGKSDICRAIAQEYNLFLIDLRLASMDPTDISGFPSLNGNRNRSIYAPPEYFPLEQDSIPKGYDGFLLFLDEMNSAPNAVQSAAYQVVLDRKVGQHKLHPKCKVVAAGNLETDNAIVNRLSTAMQSRLVHLELEVSLEAWLNWANTNNIDYRVISFIQWRPELLHKFDPEHSDNTFSCPRTWSFLSRLIKNWQTIPVSKLPLMAGTVGEGAAYEFKAFTDIVESLPSIDQILNAPELVTIPDDPSILYAIIGIISHNASTNNIDKLMRLVNRLPLEFQTICLQDTFKRNSTILTTPSIKEWIAKNANELIA